MNTAHEPTPSISKSRKFLIAILILVTLLAGLSLLLAYLSSTGAFSGSLWVMDEDISHHALGWMIALPIIFIVFAVVIIAVLGAGIIAAGAIAMAVVLALLSIVFGLAMVVLPIAAFLAVPVLVVWGIAKLANRKPSVVYVTQPVSPQ